MLTCCPHCQTAFRVTPEQLKVRQGQVRCGACRAVFDALDSLADETPLVAEPASRDDPVHPEVTTEPVAAPIPRAAAEPAAKTEPAPPVVKPETMAVAAVDSVPATVPARRWPWRIGVLLLLLLASAQGIYSFRVDLTVLAPEWRPALVAACTRFGCTLPRPRKAELISIETSDLAPAKTEQLLLTATLKNAASYDQEFPHLELTLTDTRDAALLRRVLAPADYLPPQQNPAAGFAARSDSTIRLTLDAPGMAAAGYRLYLFYP